MVVDQSTGSGDDPVVEVVPMCTDAELTDQSESVRPEFRSLGMFDETGRIRGAVTEISEGGVPVDQTLAEDGGRGGRVDGPGMGEEERRRGAVRVEWEGTGRGVTRLVTTRRRGSREVRVKTEVFNSVVGALRKATEEEGFQLGALWVEETGRASARGKKAGRNFA